MILINGCSFTYGTGLKDQDETFTHQVCNHYQLSFKNISVAAASNDRIRSSTIQEILNKKYQYAFINFTNVPRIHLGETFGLKTILLRVSTVEKFNKNLENFWSLFLDELFWVKNYFENIFILQEFLKSHSVPYTFTNTSEFVNFDKWVADTKFAENYYVIPDSFKEFYNLKKVDPKFYQSITDEYNSIIRLINNIEMSKFSDLGKKKIFGSGFETGNDHYHPGKKAHDYMKNLILEHLINDKDFIQLYLT